jgi:hypothetical protein
MIPVYKKQKQKKQEKEQHLHGIGNARRQYFNPLRHEIKAGKFINTTVKKMSYNYDLLAYFLICLFAYLLTCLLAPWRRVLFENLTSLQLVKNFPFY